ncbi:MAG: polysaccharide pyruvyl transferase family protein [archaeon YNP-LCB-024-027]|nr:polysaccharide pyruvyl transferase family protein [Candidatus Culexarchaeum yellowstonense]
MGDDVILYAIVKRLSRFIDKSRIVVVSSQLNANLQFIRSRYGVEAVSLRDLLGFLKVLFSSKVLVLGGGGILQPGFTIFSIFLYSLLFKLSGCKVVLLSVGVEFPHSFSLIDKFLVRLLVGISDVVTVRDLVSRAFLNSLAVSKPILVFRDLSYLIYDDLSRFRSNFEFNGGGDPYVILVLKDISSNVMPLMGEHLDLHYLVNVLSDFCNYLIDVRGVKVYFLIAQHGLKSDLNIALKVLKNVNNLSMVHVVFYGSMPFNRLLDLLRGSICVISMRLHPLILASMMGKPVIGLSYSNKVKTFMYENDLGSFLIDLTRSYDSRSFKLIFQRILNDSESFTYNYVEGYYHEVLSKASIVESFLEQNI